MRVGYTSELTIPVFTAKNAFDSSNYNFDFSNALAAGDIISSLGTITASPIGLTIGPGSIVSGSGGTALAVQARISGGNAGQIYTIMVQVYTAGGDQFARAANLQVQ